MRSRSACGTGAKPSISGSRTCVATARPSSGRLGNTPRMVRGYELGQTIRFRRSDMVDWMYVERGAIRGNFTACALLTQEPAAERADYMRRTGLVCGR
jgi:uncharacterized protein YegJ (DUF2314 family)